jgi:NADH:ubiquinone oxidoreductase subunit H
MDSPIWLYVGIVVVALLIGTMGARMLKGLQETLPGWLFYTLIIGFIVFVIAMIYSVANPPL